MSADNWAICPRCKKANDEEWQAIQQGLFRALTKNEHLEWQQKKENFIELEWTLKEVYELRTEQNGMFYINYTCDCQKCGFHFGYKYQEYLFAEE